MALSRSKPAKQTVEDEVLATAHGLARALHRVGAMDELSMRDLDRLCLPPRPDYTGPDVRRISKPWNALGHSTGATWLSATSPRFASEHYRNYARFLVQTR